jgi:hypothetical protein
MGTEEPVGKGFVLAQEAQQEVFGLDIRRAELARFIARKEYDSTGFLGVSLEHGIPCPVTGADAEGNFGGAYITSTSA